MSSRERVLSAVRRQDVDHVPCSPRFIPLHPRQRVGCNYQFPWEPTQFERQVEYCVQELGIDPVLRMFLNNYHPAPVVTSRVWEEDGIIHKAWSTPSGDLHAAVPNDEHWVHGSDVPFFHDRFNRYVQPWLKTPQDLECLRHIIRPAGDAELPGIMSRFTALMQLAQRFGTAIEADIGLGLTGAMQAAGPSGISVLVAEQPGLVDGFLELEHQRNLRHIQIAVDLGVGLIHRNGFYETPDFYTMEFLEQFLAPRLNAEARLAHEGGAAIVYTLHGGVMPMLDYLATLDFDGIYGLDIAGQDVDLPLIAQSLGKRMSFWTGPSRVPHMWSDDPDVVRQAVRETFDVFGKRGLLVTACPSVHSTMPWENTLAMVDEWKKLR